MDTVAAPPKTVKPICPHFGICGGCDMQDVAYADQMAYKQSVLKMLFSHIAEESDWKPFIATSDEYPVYFRNKIRFSFVYHEGRIWPSRHKRGEENADIPVRECFLQSEHSMAVVNWIADYGSDHGWTLFDPTKSTGWLKHVLLREGKSTDETLVSIVTIETEIPKSTLFAEALHAAFPGIISIYQTRTNGRDNFSSTDHLLSGEQAFHEKIGEHTFKISPHAFFQTNSTMVTALYDAVADSIGSARPQVLWDLYAGSATIGIYLKDRAEKVFCVENNPQNIADAAWNLNQNRAENVTMVGGSVEEVCTSTFMNHNGKPDCIVVDPPRAGLSTVCRNLLAGIRPETLVYVSCNPSTCLRDTRDLLRRGFKLKSVQGIDMFPHTLHCEMIVTFQRT